MKQVIACLLALVLTMGLLILPVSAEAIADGDTPDSVVLTTGTDEVVMADDPAPIEEYGDGDVVKADGETIEEYAEDEIVKADSEPIEEYGFFAWLKNLWKSILNFFGL